MYVLSRLFHSCSSCFPMSILASSLLIAKSFGLNKQRSETLIPASEVVFLLYDLDESYCDLPLASSIARWEQQKTVHYSEQFAISTMQPSQPDLYKRDEILNSEVCENSVVVSPKSPPLYVPPFNGSITIGKNISDIQLITTFLVQI